MTGHPPDRRATDIFLAALDTPPGERPRFVERACGENEDLRRHVERLLTLEERTDGLLEPQARADGRASLVPENSSDAEETFFDAWAEAMLPSTPTASSPHPVEGAGGRRTGAEAAAAADALQGIDACFPGFEIRKLLGQGGFGAVFRAYDSRLSREVALKVLLPRARVNPTAQSRFLDEAKILAQVRHPNVITVHSILEVDDRIGLVMELIDGESLEEFVERTDRLGAEEASQIGLQLCAALAAVHRKGLVHRDVKPANVLRERGGRILLCDFGLGVFVERDRLVERAGSPLFMAPEQIDGGQVDARADIYALGVLLYWCVTKDFPYADSSAIRDLFAAKLEHNPRPLRDSRPDLPARFIEVVHRALERDPAARFQSAGELEQALVACLGAREAPDGSAVSAPRAREERSAPGALWKPWALAAALVVIAGLILTMAFLPSRGPIREVSWWRERAWEAEPVNASDTIRPGDRLSLRFEADRPLFVYVLNDDGEGAPALLFPQQGADTQNPLPADVAHVLPGTLGGKLQSFQLREPKEREALFVLASTTSIDELELLAPAPPEGPPEVAVRTRGMTSTAKEFDPETDGKTFLAELLERLRAGEWQRAAEGRWVETTHLRTE